MGASFMCKPCSQRLLRFRSVKGLNDFAVVRCTNQEELNMSWSRKGALLGAIVGLLVLFVVAINRGTVGQIAIIALIMWPAIGALIGWAVGKILSK